MKITQVYLNKENLWDSLSDDDLYLVQFSKPKSRKENGRKEMPPLPYGLSFKSISKMSVCEMMEWLKNEKIAIVKIED